MGPLAEGLTPHADPDPGLATRIRATLHALGAPEKAAADLALLTTGAQRDLGAGTFPQLASIGGLTFLDAQDVADRGIERHDGKVSRVLTYGIQPPAKPRFVLVYLTAEGQVTDFDLVDD